MNEKFNQILNLIGENKLERALNELSLLLRGRFPREENKFTTTKNRLKEDADDYLHGYITREVYQTNKALNLRSLINIVRNLEQKYEKSRNLVQDTQNAQLALPPATQVELVKAIEVFEDDAKDDNDRSSARSVVRKVFNNHHDAFLVAAFKGTARLALEYVGLDPMFFDL